jgi:hypothetical protein
LHAVASNDAVWVADDESWVIARHALADSSTLRIQGDRAGPTVTDDLIEAELMHRYSQRLSGAALQSYIDEQRPLSYHAVAPAIGKVLSGAAGSVWISDYYNPLDRSVSWFRLSPDGVLTGQISIPSNQRPIRFAADLVILVEVDSLGRETIRVYPIQPANS